MAILDAMSSDPLPSETFPAAPSSKPPRAVSAEPRLSVHVTADRILVALPPDTERKSKGGIVIPATAESIDRKGVWGEVIGVGPHVRHASPGDEVLYLPDDAIEVDVRGDSYLIVRERDVHAVASRQRDGATGLYL